MALFSSEDENKIKDRQKEQDGRELELERRLADIEAREQALAEDFASLKSSQKDLAERDREVFELEQTVEQREIAAKAGSVEKQREAFREAIEGRIQSLDERQDELNALQEKLAKELGVITKNEGDLASREAAVLERELKANGGFADKLRILHDEIKIRENACSDKEEAIRDREKSVLADNKELELDREDLRKRGEGLAKAEQERDAGYAELRAKLDEELHQKRLAGEEEGTRSKAEELASIEKELSSYRETRLKKIEEEGNRERDRTKDLISKEQSRLSEEIELKRSEVQTEREDLEKRRGNLEAAKNDLVFRERMADSKEEALAGRSNNLEQEIFRRLAERQKSFESTEKSLQQENGRLRDSLATCQDLLSCFDELKRRLGGEEPEKILQNLNEKTDELKELRKKLAESPSPDLQDRFESQKKEIIRLQAKASELEAEAEDHRQRLAGENQLRVKLSDAETENKSFKNRVEVLDAECSRLREERKRMLATYEREEEREDRIRDIESPHLALAELPARRPASEIDEVEWLDSIEKQCVDYGLRFHPRILRAFHTSLKTAEWSPITVLAGVSGTGKSELPRLYSHFGGIPFLPISVQPNWDSQESMLGFFNSIDNNFQSEPVLRFLAQSQKKNTEDYPGLEDVVCMVLLDEMNLAHPELYFAEFLSKLEYRRGLKGNNVPSLDVKLGARIADYPVPLGRNVLWAGTMNQDETTKSLSDKVLDRSIVIHFPRPTSLERRLKLKPLPQASDLLPRNVWESWWSRESNFSVDEIQPFKSFIEEMNIALSQTGRALGHRIWQSIEYYLANYPDVRVARKTGDAKQLRQAMRIAFEDQLVQKVMPKLRGIETRGRSRSECLDKIRAQIVEADYPILGDFDLACKFGHGQFIWQSADYLREAEEPDRDSADQTGEGDNGKHETTNDGGIESKSSGNPDANDHKYLSEPPEDFKSGEADRMSVWENLSPKQKKLYKK